MNAKYLIRFDDLCPTMNWRVWGEIESMLLEYDINPLLAVVPDNHDEKLIAGPAHPHFWDEVRKWQAWGWTIGMHGHNHRFVTDNGGIVGLHRRSEFAGLSREEQEIKLRCAIEVFHEQEIETQVWVAPAHSFDRTTISVLHDLGISVISDGFAISPYQDLKGVFWVPQQLWRFRWRPFGVWTVCYHHNHWSEDSIKTFKKDIARHRQKIAGFHEVLSARPRRGRNWLDNFYGSTHRGILTLRN